MRFANSMDCLFASLFITVEGKPSLFKFLLHTITSVRQFFNWKWKRIKNVVMSRQHVIKNRIFRSTESSKHTCYSLDFISLRKEHLNSITLKSFLIDFRQYRACKPAHFSFLWLIWCFENFQGVETATFLLPLPHSTAMNQPYFFSWVVVVVKMLTSKASLV